MDTKPRVTIDLDGPDGNIFVVVGKSIDALRKIDTPEKTIRDMKNRVMSSKSYDEALDVINDYVKLS